MLPYIRTHTHTTTTVNYIFFGVKINILFKNKLYFNRFTKFERKMTLTTNDDYSDKRLFLFQKRKKQISFTNMDLLCAHFI